jgi:hypothetical protein
MPSGPGEGQTTNIYETMACAEISHHATRRRMHKDF